MRGAQQGLPSAPVGGHFCHGGKEKGVGKCTHGHNYSFGSSGGDFHLMVSIFSVREEVGHLLRGREVGSFEENEDDLKIFAMGKGEDLSWEKEGLFQAMLRDQVRLGLVNS